MRKREKFYLPRNFNESWMISLMMSASKSRSSAIFSMCRGLSYAFSTELDDNPYYYGTTVLNGDVSGHLVTQGEASSDELLFAAATSFSAIPGTPGDIRSIIATGPFDIPAGGNSRAVFAILGGNDLVDLQANADAAKAIDLTAAFPIILSADDVPHDQGGRVTLNWIASSLDIDVAELPYYSIWRALPEQPGLTSSNNSMSEITRDFRGPARRMAEAQGLDLAWEWIANQPAHRFATYSYTAETLYDSTSVTNGIHYFMVSAHTSDPNIFFDSDPDSGYSVDNLAPIPPTNLAGMYLSETEAVELHWNPNSEEALWRSRRHLPKQEHRSLAACGGTSCARV